jgi:hypothetical protein
MNNLIASLENQIEKLYLELDEAENIANLAEQEYKSACENKSNFGKSVNSALNEYGKAMFRVNELMEEISIKREKLIEERKKLSHEEGREL